MSLATPSVINGSSIVAPAPDRSNCNFNIDDDNDNDNDNDESNQNVHNTTSARTLETVTLPMDRQPQAPRRSISPVQRWEPTNGKDTTNKAANIDNINSHDSDDESDIGEDLLFISQLYGSNGSCGEDKEAEGDCSEYNNIIMNARASTKVSFSMPPPPPLRHINEEDNSSPSQSNSKTKHGYDRTRQPQRSSIRKPNSKNRNIHSVDNVHHNKTEISRGISRNHSAHGTKDTIRGSGSLHSIRMRGSIYPVHRRQSIGFEETVRVQEITPTVELNDGNTRDLWLQADEAMEIKARRRSLLVHYKEREARKKKEAERMKREREKVEREQTVKNLLNPSTVTLNSYLSPSSSTTKKQHPEWPGSLKNADLPLPGNLPSGRRWKATIQNNEHPSVMGLSVPSRGGEDLSSSISSLYMCNNAASSFMSTSSGGSSFSGHDSDSFRGLEKYIDRSGKHQKNMVWDAVLIEQDEQLQFGYYDDERIANLYQTVQNQHDGQQKAEGRARKDRKAADNYLMTPRTLKLMRKSINISTNNISDLTYIDLLQDDADEDADKDTDASGNSGLGNHGKTCAKHDNDTKEETRTSTRKTTALKSRAKKHSKYLRRLSA
jgi:hypothetical protein